MRTHTRFWIPVWMNYNVSIELEVKTATDFLLSSRHCHRINSIYSMIVLFPIVLTELYCKPQLTGEVTPRVLFSKLFKLIMTSVKFCITLLFPLLEETESQIVRDSYVLVQKILRSNPHSSFYVKVLCTVEKVLPSVRQEKERDTRCRNVELFLKKLKKLQKWKPFNPVLY